MTMGQTDDLRRAAQAILDAVLGRFVQPTVISPQWAQVTGLELDSLFLQTLDEEEFR